MPQTIAGVEKNAPNPKHLKFKSGVTNDNANKINPIFRTRFWSKKVVVMLWSKDKFFLNTAEAICVDG